MTNKDRMREQIMNHGLKLLRIFHWINDGIDPWEKNYTGPVELCKKLHRLESKVHRWNEDCCNGLIDNEELEDKKHEAFLKSLDNILQFRSHNIPVFINGDPRGYALKIDDDFMRENNIDLYRDMGGYGILAPDFDGNN